jgi:BirA family transcriptional regulator, biotin operon repressor / biotin---[acetyl-CoA-carboxylase] ligase
VSPKESNVPLTVEDLERALAAAGVSAPVRSDEVTGSTNDSALEMAADGAPEWTLVAAAHQTSGRGRMGRAWADSPGRALLFSFVVRPSGIAPERAGLLPLLAGLCMAEAAREVAALEVGCKWPNDLLLDDRKVGGVLVESRVGAGAASGFYAAIGVGVNLDPPEGVEGAGGLGAVDPAVLLTAFLRGFRQRYEGDASTLGRRVADEYAPRCVTIGRDVEATRIDGRRVHGRAVEVLEDGSLALETADGRALVAFGEIAHLDR